MLMNRLGKNSYNSLLKLMCAKFKGSFMNINLIKQNLVTHNFYCTNHGFVSNIKNMFGIVFAR